MNNFFNSAWLFFSCITLVPLVSAWLIGRGVFSLLEKKSTKTANSVALTVALLGQMVIFCLVMWAYATLNHGFSR